MNFRQVRVRAGLRPQPEGRGGADGALPGHLRRQPQDRRAAPRLPGERAAKQGGFFSDVLRFTTVT